MITRNLFNYRTLLAPEGEAPAGGPAPKKAAPAPEGEAKLPKNVVGSLFGQPDMPAPPKVTEKEANKGKKGSSSASLAEDPDIFGADDDDDDPPVKKGKTAKKKDNEEEDEDDKTLDSDDEEEDAGDDDLDSPILAPKKEGKEDKVVSGKGAKDIREQLEIVSAQAKKHAEANKKLAERLKKYETVASEADLDDPTPAEKVDANKDTVFVKHKDTIISRLDHGIAIVDNELATAWADRDGVFSTTLEGYARDLKSAKTATDKSRVTKELRDRLAAKFTDADKDLDGKEAAAQVVRILTESVPDLEAMYARRAELEGAPESSRDRGSLYAVRRTAAEELVAGAGDYPDSVVEDHPHSVAAYLHSLKDHPKFKPRVENARKRVADLLAGPPELTKDEKVKLEKSGGPDLVAKTIKQRREEWTANRSKVAVKLVEALLFLPQAPDILKRLNEMSGRATEEDEDRDLMEGVREERGGGKKTERSSTASPQKKLIRDLFGTGH